MAALSSRAALAVLLILALSMIDVLVEAVFDRGHGVKVVAGDRVLASGKLLGDIRPYASANAIHSNRVADPADLEEILAWAPADDAFRLRFLELKGRIWRAEVRTDAGRPPGEYRIRVFQRGLPPAPDMPYFTIRTFADDRALRASQASLARRFLGLPPWALATGLLPLAVLLVYLTYRSAAGSVAALQAQGIGPIYRMAYRREGWEILFGLGSADGLCVGDRLDLLDARQRPTGDDLVALRVGPHSGEARLDPQVRLKPGYCVRRRDAAGSAPPSRDPE